jgi:glycosyltransferase involved in cell wall biosynthesis
VLSQSAVEQERESNASAQAMPPKAVTPDQVAMLVQGDEVYGIGTIEKLYAEAWPEMTAVCLGVGALYDWLLERGAKVELVPGLVRFHEANSAGTIARMPILLGRAKRDARRIHERLANRGIRFVHAHWRAQQLTAGYLRRFGYQSVWQINNTMNPRRLFGFGGRLNRSLANWGADLLLPASDFIGANWEGCRVPIKTIRNAAVPLYAAHNELPIDGPLRVLVAGRLEPTKGHHVAIAGVAAARKAGCDVSLDVFGGPLENNSYADVLRQQVAEAGLEERVRFMGFCSDLRQRHQDYHLGLQCRVNAEPCSLWVCETLVDGLPLIASASGGTPELVADGTTGYLYSPGSGEALAERLIHLSRQRQLLAKMRSAAFERGARQFTVQRFLDETLAAYASIDDSRLS